MFRHIRKMFEYTRLLKTPHTHLRVVMVTKDLHLKQAKSLHAQVYLENGFIADKQLNRNGHIKLEHDPYQAHSGYFVVIEKLGRVERVVATARQIKATGHKGHASFPTMAKLKLEPHVRSAIESLDPKDCVEISALAKEKGYTT